MNAKALLGACLAAALTLGASLPAGAAQIFYYDAYGGFLEGSQSLNPFPFGVFAGGRDARDPFNQPIGNGDDAWSQFSWGTPPWDPSGITSMGQENQPITADGSLEVLATLAHENERIFQWWEPGDSSAGMGEGPATIELSWSLDLFDAPDGTLVFSKRFQFELAFFETHNDGACPASLAGFARAHVSNCDDLFFVTMVKEDDGSWQPVVNGLIEFEDSFDYMGQTYEIFGSGFYELDELKGPHWSTEEGDPQPVEIQFGIVVPEPGSMALLGLGLIQLGLLARRRKKAR